MPIFASLALRNPSMRCSRPSGGARGFRSAAARYGCTLSRGRATARASTDEAIIVARQLGYWDLNDETRPRHAECVSRAGKDARGVEGIVGSLQDPRHDPARRADPPAGSGRLSVGQGLTPHPTLSHKGRGPSSPSPALAREGRGEGSTTPLPAPTDPAAPRCARRSRTPEPPPRRSPYTHPPAAPAAARPPAGRSAPRGCAAAASPSRSR